MLIESMRGCGWTSSNLICSLYLWRRWLLSSSWSTHLMCLRWCWFLIMHLIKCWKMNSSFWNSINHLCILLVFQEIIHLRSIYHILNGSLIGFFFVSSTSCSFWTYKLLFRILDHWTDSLSESLTRSFFTSFWRSRPLSYYNSRLSIWQHISKCATFWSLIPCSKFISIFHTGWNSRGSPFRFWGTIRVWKIFWL